MEIEFIPSNNEISKIHHEGSIHGTDPVQIPDAILSVDELKPSPVNKHLPPWYKKINAWHDGIKYKEGYQTAKACRPLGDFLSTGYIIPLWADYVFDYSDERDKQNMVAHTSFVSGNHSGGQFGFATSNTRYQENAIKFINPWIIKTPPGYSCLFMQPFYHLEQRFTILPAVVNTDVFDSLIHFPAFVADNLDPFIVEAGYPLIHVIPFKREPWVSKFTLFKDYANKAYKGFSYLMKNKLFFTYAKYCGKNISFK